MEFLLLFADGDQRWLPLSQDTASNASVQQYIDFTHCLRPLRTTQAVYKELCSQARKKDIDSVEIGAIFFLDLRFYGCDWMETLGIPEVHSKQHVMRCRYTEWTKPPARRKVDVLVEVRAETLVVDNVFVYEWGLQREQSPGTILCDESFALLYPGILPDNKRKNLLSKFRRAQSELSFLATMLPIRRVADRSHGSKRASGFDDGTRSVTGSPGPRGCVEEVGMHHVQRSHGYLVLRARAGHAPVLRGVTIYLDMEFRHHVTGRLDFFFVREHAERDRRLGPGVVATDHHTVDRRPPHSVGFIFSLLPGFYIRGAETILSYGALLEDRDWVIRRGDMGNVYLLQHRYLGFLSFTFEQCCSRGRFPCYVCTWLDVSMLDQLHAMESPNHAQHVHLPREVRSELSRQPFPMVAARSAAGMPYRQRPDHRYGRRSFHGRMSRRSSDDEEDVSWAAPVECNHAEGFGARASSSRDAYAAGATTTSVSSAAAVVTEPQWGGPPVGSIARGLSASAEVTDEYKEDPGAEYAEPLPRPGEPAYEFDVPLGQPRPVEDYDIRDDYPRGTVSFGSDSLNEDTSSTGESVWGAIGSEEGRRLAEEELREEARDELAEADWAEQEAREREWRDAEG